METVDTKGPFKRERFRLLSSRTSEELMQAKGFQVCFMPSFDSARDLSENVVIVISDEKKGNNIACDDISYYLF